MEEYITQRLDNVPFVKSVIFSRSPHEV